MGASFVKKASKQVADVRAFLRDAAGGNSIKYAAEKGARHFIYIPFKSQKVLDDDTQQEVVTKSIIAIQGDIHEWTTSDGKFKATVCIKGVVENSEDGTAINDGSCPICDRIADAWNVYNYRKEKEEMSCQLTGDQRKNHLEKTYATFRDERKAKETRAYMYILVVKFRQTESGSPVMGSDGLPEYELKVMKLSASRVEKITQQVANSGAELEGAELIFEYPNVEDRRLLVSQSTTTPVFTAKMLTTMYPGLKDKINADVAKFEWDGIEKAFPEWSGMSTAEAKSIMDNSFEQWDKYQKELLANPQAKYLEYVLPSPSSNPALDVSKDAVAPAPVIPSAPVIPTAATAPATAGTGAGEPVQMPGQAVGQPASMVSGIPVPPILDPNAVFANGSATPTPTLTV